MTARWGSSAGAGVVPGGERAGDGAHKQLGWRKAKEISNVSRGLGKREAKVSNGDS